MADHATCVWTGVSGTQYTYYIWPRHPDIGADQLGNYIYAKPNSQNQWVPVYIGQGDLSVRATSDHHRTSCIDSKGATAVHVHLNPKEVDRLNEERDLLANYPQAYTPTGCNVKKGG